ncbi:MAG: UDP-3-O-(3-hydroxymyristoyl)glucosamine N-acyltransferase [Bacteroidales bacterium]|jgi:UDP-3-O-[3-hydroxymyristoyl] glucosamine N-acyltransferase|nr:UDP-3-O-(3-hydroxymyristoyl)glucosamine N-acyltransferase [Bacteroidales bacterium]NLM92948.1 UDP-3-O-(3-hydroxymyristoyl)glucosamine N-acyltransferase [Bacteroidales bacterium]
MQLNPPLSLHQVAGMIGASFDGEPGFPISGINEIHMVNEGDLTFVDHPKYYEKALKSKASAIIINKEMDRPDGKALIFSDDPFRDFVSLIKKFRPFEPATGMISSTAIIGKGTIIQPGVFIGNHVVIGRNCIIHPNVTIYDHTIIGDHVIIHSGAVIGSDGLYFKRRSSHYDKLESGGRALIEDYVEIGACCTIDRGSTGDTTIGQGTKFDNHIHIGHDTIIGKNCLFAAQVGVAGCVIVEDDVILWGQVGVQKDLTIGKGAVVFGQSGISKSLEGGKTYFGSPAQEAREAMKQMALIRKLPELFEKL